MVSNNKGDGSREDGVDANAMMIKWKKERAKSSRWISSSNEAFGQAGGLRSRRKEGVPFQPMLSASANTYPTSRKRVGLHGMVAEDSDAVDPAPVPRKLRSAINKRSSQLSPPAAPDAKKKRYLTTNELRVLDENGGKRYKESLMLGSLTQDEEYVLEALCALSRMPPIGEHIQDREDGKLPKDPQDKHATFATYSEGLKEEDKHLLLKCSSGGIKNPSCTENQLGETMKDGHGCSKQRITDCQMQNIDSNLNDTSKSGTHATPFSENKNPRSNNLSDPSGDFPCFAGNRALHTTKCKAVVIALPSCEPDMPRPNGCIASAAPRQEVQQVKHNRTIPPDVHSASSDSTLRSGPMYAASKLLSSRVHPATEKVPARKGSSWKKCVIHVSISHLIKDCQAKEKQLRILPSSVPANNEKTWLQRDEINGKKCASPDSSFVERNKCEGRNEASSKGRLMPFLQPTVLSESKQKQNCDFLSLSPRGGGATGSRNAVKSCGQLRSPFLHAQVSHHSAVPFPFTRAPYAPPYTGKVVTGTSQQSQLQVAHFALGNMPSHLQQQFAHQQIWQAHFAHSRPLAGAAATLQHGRPCAASMSQNANPTSTFSASPSSIRMQGGSYQPSLSWQELQLITHSPSSLSSSNHRQPPGNSLYGSGFHHEGSHQLQLLCNMNRP